MNEWINAILQMIYFQTWTLIFKFQIGRKSLLRQRLSEPEFYGDLGYKLKKIACSDNFSALFIKIISHYIKIGYDINVLQQTACLMVNPIMVGILLSSVIARVWVGLWTLDSSDLKAYLLMRW